MSVELNKLAAELYSLMTASESKKPKAYDTKAEVVKIEGDTVWVHIPGGVDETPVSRTNNANVGDEVLVRLSGGNAWLLGNSTSPPTDDTKANEAIDQSIEALEAARISQAAAKIAEESAEYAQQKAIEVGDLVDGIAEDAKNAKENANIAAEKAESAINNAATAESAANSASYHLTEIEKVVSTLDWIATHGEYELTNDETIITGKWYFTLTSTGSYVVGSPIENPKLEGFYELTSVDEAISNYVATHLYLANDGLYVRMDSDQGAKLKITGTGIYLINADGNIISQYSDVVVLGDPDSAHIELSSDYGLSFYQTTAEKDSSGAPTNRVAYMQNDRLFIQSATLTNNLQIGNFRWVVLDHRISLKYNPVQ